MPFTQMFDGEEMKKLFNVTQAVGKNSSNRDVDVKLVQYMLKKVYGVPDLCHSKPKGEMTIDGKCGPITCNWILKFQCDINLDESPGNCAMDGRVDTARNKQRTSMSKTYHTIVFLNYSFRLYFPEIHENPMLAADMPSDLKTALLSPYPV